MAKRRRKTRRRARASTKIVYRNRPAKKHRRRRTHYRRNAPGGFVGQTMGLAINGAVGGVAILVGEGGARLMASDVFGKDPGSLAGGAIQAGTGLVGGMAVEFIGRGRHRELARTVAHGIVSGVAASLMRTALKQMNVPIVNRALSDDGSFRIIRPLGRRGINGYYRPGARTMNGYYRPGARTLNGVNERVEQQLGYRA